MGTAWATRSGRAERPTLGRVARVGDARIARRLPSRAGVGKNRQHEGPPSVKRGASDAPGWMRHDLSRALDAGQRAKRRQRAVRPCSATARGRAMRL